MLSSRLASNSMLESKNHYQQWANSLRRAALIHWFTEMVSESRIVSKQNNSVSVGNLNHPKTVRAAVSGAYESVIEVGSLRVDLVEYKAAWFESTEDKRASAMQRSPVVENQVLHSVIKSSVDTAEHREHRSQFQIRRTPQHGESGGAVCSPSTLHNDSSPSLMIMKQWPKPAI